MTTITTEAWVLHEGPPDVDPAPPPGELCHELFTFAELAAHEVLVEPIYGCWEANMTHALQRRPVDVCRQRKEAKVVLGNAGVVRVLRAGEAVSDLAEGDVCITFCNGQWDRYGYTVKVLAYDAPQTMGVLAKRLKLHRRQLIPIPEASPYSLRQWAAFSLRYITAWANWNVAYRCWQAQMPDVDPVEVSVWGWGGGVTLAELALARQAGCQTFMMASSDARLALIQTHGITPIDRRAFAGLDYQEELLRSDAGYRAAYHAAEELFVEIVRENTQGAGASIFVDNIGLPVLRPTLKVLARQGVITTAGWKCGMNITTLRAIECINRHIHVNTHYASYTEGLQAVAAAERMAWMAPDEGVVYGWEEIPALAADYAAGRLQAYFPIFAVNPA